MRPSFIAALVANAALLALGGAGGCSGGAGRARDVVGSAGSGSTSSGAIVVPEPPTAAPPVAKANRPRPVAHAAARALAVDDTHLYYGDSEDDGVYAVLKTGGEPLRIARHAPVAGAFALNGSTLVWIASPGDAVLKAPIGGGVQPVTLRDRGIFADVAAASDDIFIAEAIGGGGALLRVTGATASRLGTFDGPPRAVMADRSHVFILTPSKIFRTPHQRAELETLATGTRFTYSETDDDFVYVVTEIDRERVVARVAKTGGSLSIVARGVREAPIDVEGGELFFFDATRPQLRAVAASGGDSRVLAEDEALGAVSALEADTATVYVGTGIHESAYVVAIQRR